MLYCRISSNSSNIHYIEITLFHTILYVWIHPILNRNELCTEPALHSRQVSCDEGVQAMPLQYHNKGPGFLDETVYRAD